MEMLAGLDTFDGSPPTRGGHKRQSWDCRAHKEGNSGPNGRYTANQITWHTQAALLSRAPLN